MEQKNIDDTKLWSKAKNLSKACFQSAIMAIMHFLRTLSRAATLLLLTMFSKSVRPNYRQTAKQADEQAKLLTVYSQYIKDRFTFTPYNN